MVKIAKFHADEILLAGCRDEVRQAARSMFTPTDQDNLTIKRMAKEGRHGIRKRGALGEVALP